MSEPQTRDPIADAAQSLLDILGEHDEEIIDETAAATWPKGDADYWDVAGSNDSLAHNDRTFALVCRALAPLLIAAADAADKRVGK